MRLPRIFVPVALTEGMRLRLEATASQHLVQVLRARPGAEVRVFNGNGQEYAGHLLILDKRGMEIEIGATTFSEPPSPLDLHLILGISRGDRMDFAIQKAVELGITRLSPVLTERCVVKLDSQRQRRRLAHWQRILTGACEQSERCRLPAVEAPVPLPAALDRLANGGTRLLLHHRGGGRLDRIAHPEKRLVLLIGPEGGLAEKEVEQARQRGFAAIRLGPRVLRTETAPLAALAAIQMLWGDFRSASGSR